MTFKTRGQRIERARAGRTVEWISISPRMMAGGMVTVMVRQEPSSPKDDGEGGGCRGRVSPCVGINTPAGERAQGSPVWQGWEPHGQWLREAGNT